MRAAKPENLSLLDPTAASPFYRQIYDRFRDAIANGMLKPGDRIPSARALTKELGLARGTIETAYSLLAAEGYTEARGQAGTIVSPDLKPRTPIASPVPLPDIPDIDAVSFRPDSILPFQMGLPALDAFPRKIWARLGARSVRAMQPSDMIHPSVYGLPLLRAEIARYLQVSRGISCRPSQVFVTSGYRQTVELIGYALLKAGDRVWLEDPGYPPTGEIFNHMRIEGVSVPVDGEGMVVSDEAGAQGARSGGHACASEPALHVLVVAPAPRAVGLGRAKQGMDHRRRLRWRIPLCQPPTPCVEEPRSRWAGALCRHVQQGALSRHAACVSRGAGTEGGAV